MSTLEAIVKDLKALPAPALKEAAAYIHRLRETSIADREAILRKTAGGWAAADADLIERAIEEGCERIDSHDM